MKWFWTSTCSLMFLTVSLTGFSRVDSVGLKVIQGKAYVMHEVDPGENLSQLSRRYRSSVSTIVQVNELTAEAVNVGQVLLIPTKAKAASLSLSDVASAKTSSPKPVVKQNTVKSNASVKGGGPKKHTVQKGETLYGISRKYKVSVAEIQKWNNLAGAGIQTGQTLIVSSPEDKDSSTKPAPKPVANPVTVPKPAPTTEKVRQVKTVEKASANATGKVTHKVQSGETLFAISRKYGVGVAEIKKLNKLTDTNLQIGQTLIISKAPATPEVKTTPNPNQGKGFQEMLDEATGEETATTKAPEMKVLTAAEKPANLPPDAKVVDYTDEYSGENYKRVEESGKAGLIEDFSTDQTKFYAFHKYLPKGSYIRVDYPEKSQSILVEVINTLPMDNSHVVLLTAKCLDYLRMKGGGGEVTLRYVVPISK